MGFAIVSLSCRRCAAASQASQRGFNLIEVMVVVALLGIALAIALPNMASMVRSNRSKGEIEALASSIRMAKTEAIKRGQTVVLCASADALRCSGSNGWHSGWLVFEEGATEGQPADETAIIASEQAFKAGDSLLASANTALITFNRQGFAFGLPSGGKVVFSLSTSPEDDNAKRCLVLDLSGNPVIERRGGPNCA